MRAAERAEANASQRRRPAIIDDKRKAMDNIRAELAFSPSSEKWPGNTFLDVKSRLESIARIGLLKKNDPEVAYGR